MNLFKNLAVAGSSTVDAGLKPEFIAFARASVDFTAYGVRRVLYYDGPPLSGEGKATATRPLDHFQHVRGATVRAGGGLVHSARELRRALSGAGLVLAVDSSAGHPVVRTALAEGGIRHVPVGTEEPPTNLELQYRRRDNGRAARTVLKSPSPASPVGFGGTVPSLESLDALLLNSCKNAALVRTLSDEAHARGTPQFSVLTTALDIHTRVQLQLGRDRLSQANWAELQNLAAGMGLACPQEDEDTVHLSAAAEVLRRLTKEAHCPDLIVTFGPRGTLVRSCETGAVFHIGIAPRYRAPVVLALNRHPGLVNGRGDRFFARAATAWLDRPAGTGCVVRAAIKATLAVLGEAGATLGLLSNSWLQVGSIANETRLRKTVCHAMECPE